MPDIATFANGITFVFAGQTYTATSIAVSRSAADFDVTSTDIPVNGLRRFRLSEIENVDIKVDWIGLVVPTVTATATFSLTSGLGHIGSKAFCSGLNVTASAGELIKGSATFKVSYD